MALTQLRSEPNMANDRAIFNFFGLPRELRNEIYSYLTRDFTLDSGLDENNQQRKCRIIVKGAPIISLPLISRQFRSEYEGEVDSLPTVVVQDVGSILVGTKVKKSTDHFSKVHFYLLASRAKEITCDTSVEAAIRDVPLHCQWPVLTLASIPQLKEVNISVYVPSSFEDPAEWMKHAEIAKIRKALEALTKIPRLTTLSTFIFVWPSGIPGSDQNWDNIYDCYRRPVAQWKVGEGWRD